MKVIAHRGFSSRAPENTMAAFREALEFGVDGLEFDVHLTKDGQLVICHDASIDRTTDGNGLIAAQTLRELQQFDAGRWFAPHFQGERIPAARELFALVKGSTCLLNVEIKHDTARSAPVEEAVVSGLQEFGLVDQAIVSSFDHYRLHRIRQLEPRVRTAPLYTAALFKPWQYAKTLGAAAVHPYFRTVTKDIVSGCHDSGILIHPYTVNEPEALSAMRGLGVDAVITDYPERVGKTI